MGVLASDSGPSVGRRGLVFRVGEGLKAFGRVLLVDREDVPLRLSDKVNRANDLAGHSVDVSLVPVIAVRGLDLSDVDKNGLVGLGEEVLGRDGDIGDASSLELLLGGSESIIGADLGLGGRDLGRLNEVDAGSDDLVLLKGNIGNAVYDGFTIL